MDPDVRIISIQIEAVEDAREMLRDIAGAQDQDMAIRALKQQDSLPANYKVQHNISYKLMWHTKNWTCFSSKMLLSLPGRFYNK